MLMRGRPESMNILLILLKCNHNGVKQSFRVEIGFSYRRVRGCRVFRINSGVGFDSGRVTKKRRLAHFSCIAVNQNFDNDTHIMIQSVHTSNVHTRCVFQLKTVTSWKLELGETISCCFFMCLECRGTIRDRRGGEILSPCSTGHNSYLNAAESTCNNLSYDTTQNLVRFV